MHESACGESVILAKSGVLGENLGTTKDPDHEGPIAALVSWDSDPRSGISYEVQYQRVCNLFVVSSQILCFEERTSESQRTAETPNYVNG